MTRLDLVEDMSFADTADDIHSPLSARITNIDEGRVTVEYERTIVSHGGTHGVIYDVEGAGMDVFDEEQVHQMIESGVWTLTSAPFRTVHDGDDS